MPTESRRLRRRITGRDRWFFAVLAAGALVGTPAAIAISLNQSASHASDGCVTTMRASIMGGATYKYCGADVAPACRQFSARDKELAARCVELGVLRHR
jgi:hypothetical protein